jgi:hypothetical protein
MVDLFWFMALDHVLPTCRDVACWLGQLRAVQKSDSVVINEVHIERSGIENDHLWYGLGKLHEFRFIDWLNEFPDDPEDDMPLIVKILPVDEVKKGRS